LPFFETIGFVCNFIRLIKSEQKLRLSILTFQGRVTIFKKKPCQSCIKIVRQNRLSMKKFLLLLLLCTRIMALLYDLFNFDKHLPKAFKLFLGKQNSWEMI